MLQTLMCYAKVHIKNKLMRLNFNLFIYYIDLIVISLFLYTNQLVFICTIMSRIIINEDSAKTALIYNLRHVLG
jgi:hypothetical protein